MSSLDFNFIEAIFIYVLLIYIFFQFIKLIEVYQQLESLKFFYDFITLD